MTDHAITAPDVDLRPEPNVAKRWIATAILAAVPFVLTLYQYESHTENGVVTSERYRDWSALGAAILLALLGLSIVPSLLRASPRRSLFGAWLAVTVLIAVIHGARAFGIIGPRVG